MYVLRNIRDGTQALGYYLRFIEKHYAAEFHASINFSDLASPYYLETILVLQDDAPVALCSLFSNPELFLDGPKMLCFGYYECVSDAEVAEILLKALESAARAEGCATLVGPLNGSTWNNYRFSLQPIDRLYFTERHHHFYYNEQLIAHGFQILAHYESRIDSDLKMMEARKSQQVHTHWRGRNYVLRSIDMNRFDEEIRRIHAFCLEAFKRNFLYTSISSEDFLRKYKPVERFIDPEFVLLAEEEDELIGFIFALPDLYSTDEKRLVVKTVAKKPGSRFAGISHVLAEELMRRAKSKGYTALIHAFMHVENASSQISRQFSGQLFRRYGLYSKTLGYE